MTGLIDMGYSGLRKIISGGQVGVDRGALAAALAFGVATGGCAPRGWRTVTGSAPELGSLYGLIEHVSPEYPPRTEANVLAGDGTLVIASDRNSAGTALTIRYCLKHSKPYQLVEPRRTESWIAPVKELAEWIINREIEVLNVAGNHRDGAYHADVTMVIVNQLFVELEKRDRLVKKD